MDANGQRFWLLADAKHWTVAPGRTEWDPIARALRLARTPQEPNLFESGDAEHLVAQCPQALDGYGTRAWWDAKARRVFAAGALPQPVSIFYSGQPVTGLAMGYDGVLYVAAGDRVVFVDRRDRWPSYAVPCPSGFTAWRVAADPRGGVWALDREGRELARVEGSLLTVTASLEDDPVAVACSPSGRVAVLGWRDAQDARLWLDGRYIALHGVRRPYSAAWLSDHAIALLLPGASEAAVFCLSEEDTAFAAGDFYPCDADCGPFFNGVTVPPECPQDGGHAPLHRISLPSFATAGEAENRIALDSGDAQTVWHRLYMEAKLPPGCAVSVLLAANDDNSEPREWFEHRFGDAPDGVPMAAKASAPSELPFHPGLMGGASLYTVLVQRAGHKVRALQGRFLHVRAGLSGNGRATPEIAALRAWASRFSYASHYLPALYRGSDAESDHSMRADFLERFLGIFESVLTPLEDRVANAHLLTDPASARPESLDWLANWVGMAFDTALPPERRRDMLRAAPEIRRWHGTLRGLETALDAATGGGVAQGHIVVVENFRLRRTFATILGADYADENNPLLAGLVASGNSYVGDTLLLGRETKKELLGLLGDNFEKNVARLYEELAHRVTVLVHRAAGEEEMGLVRRIVASETPAHVTASVIAASSELLVGVAALIGIDTHLGEKPAPRSPVADRKIRIAESGFIRRAASLDPRLEGRDVERPSAVVTAHPGDAISLDASLSTAPRNRRIVVFRWTLDGATLETAEPVLEVPAEAAGTHKFQLVVVDDTGMESEPYKGAA